MERGAAAIVLAGEHDSRPSHGGGCFDEPVARAARAPLAFRRESSRVLEGVLDPPFERAVGRYARWRDEDHAAHRSAGEVHWPDMRSIQCCVGACLAEAEHQIITDGAADI